MKTKRLRADPRAPERHGFTLLELLAVIAIIGVLAAITLPNLRSFKPSAMAAATRQLLDDIGRARQLAISQRTTVFMVFVPVNYAGSGAFNALSPEDRNKATALLDKQLVAYSFVSLRRLGDQPGQATAKYHTSWKSLPEGAFIMPQKFGVRNFAQPWLITNLTDATIYRVTGLNWTNSIPFPDETAGPSGGGYIPVPYLAFNHMGQLVDAAGQPTGVDEVIPLAVGSVTFPKVVAPGILPTFNENPRGNSSNSFNVIKVDWVTGRARAERQEIR